MERTPQERAIKAEKDRHKHQEKQPHLRVLSNLRLYDNDSSQLALNLKDLGEDAGFEDHLGPYNFRRWANSRYLCNPSTLAVLRSKLKRIDHFTDQEGNRILSQSGTEIFKKHYQDESVKRDLQHLGLLRRSPSTRGMHAKESRSLAPSS
ncbi:hypothetical protein V8E54_007800 [Elaphomyces granulatus]